VFCNLIVLSVFHVHAYVLLMVIKLSRLNCNILGYIRIFSPFIKIFNQVWNTFICFLLFISLLLPLLFVHCYYFIGRIAAICSCTQSAVVCLFVCLSVCMSVVHVHESCENGWTNGDAVWELGRVGPRNHVLDGVNVVNIHFRLDG